ncbi:unnamed protein product [Euphydryas editha]|uniref:Reverse transcriptase domain-containing protein n=1 Tax=Euphydryas editha TaxID=104508 RepID=A0AAU9TW69_EUPED|nr:unnamed protein product [Euphydryas editha]
MRSSFVDKKDGGGVLVAITKKLISKRVTQWESNNECLWIIIKNGLSEASRQMVLCAIYLPPPVHLLSLEHFIDNCNYVFENCNVGDVVLIGDFNLGAINWDRGQHSTLPSTCQSFLDFIDMNKLTQQNVIKNPSGRLLDLVLTSEALSSHICEASNSLSDIDKLHPPLDINIYFKKEYKLPYNSSNTRPNFYRADYSRIIELLEEQNRESLFAGLDVNEMVNVFYDVVHGIIRECIPLLKSKSNKYPQWFNKEIIRCLKEKNNLRRRYKKYNNPMDHLQLKLVGRRCQKLAATLYNTYLEHIEEKIKENPKLLWTHIRNKRGGTSAYPKIMTDGLTVSSDSVEISSLFANYFCSMYSPNLEKDVTCLNNYLNSLRNNSQLLVIPTIAQEIVQIKLEGIDSRKSAGPDGIPPIFIHSCASALALPLTLIFNSSLSSGIFPTAWKTARVVPIHKSGNDDLIANYRPISILSTFAKIFESLVCPYVQHHLKLYLSEDQHGFVGRRSTTTNLLGFTESLVQSIDSGEQYDVIYTDFTKAFDKVSHSLLTYKMSVYGIEGPLLAWFNSYLSDRSFSVVLNGSQSKEYPITSGVPQGSHLGPVLFNLFINDVVSSFLFSRVFMYADDLKFARVIKCDHDAELLQSDLDRFIKWCESNKMHLNTKKCIHVKFSRKLRTINFNYHIGEELLKEVETVRDLGVIFDKKVTFIPHIDSIVGSAARALGFVIRNVRSFRHASTKTVVYNSLVRSILEYCSVVWRPHYATHCLRLERIQKRFLWHLAYSVGKTSQLRSYESRLKYFNINSLALRRDLIDLLFLYKLIRGKIDSACLLGLFRFRAPSRIPRATITPLCPPLRKTVLGSYSPVCRLCKVLNSCSDVVDINFDSYPKFYGAVLKYLKSNL